MGHLVFDTHDLGDVRHLRIYEIYETRRDWRGAITSFPFPQKIIDYQRDYLIDYFGFKTLERAYLLKIDNIIIETKNKINLERE